MVVVMTEQSNVKWCVANMKWSMKQGIKAVICADAHVRHHPTPDTYNEKVRSHQLWSSLHISHLKTAS